MQGDEKRRFCDHCQLHVHNLSAMSQAEQQALLSQRETRRCVAYLDANHSLRVQTGTWLLLQRLLRPWRASLVLIALLFPVGFSEGASATPQPVPPRLETQDAKQVRGMPDGKLVLGGIMPYRPWWRRILFFWE